MKILLGKATEQILVGIGVSLQDVSSYKQDLQKIQFQLHKQDIRLDRIERHIPCILELSKMLGSTIKDSTPMESTSEKQKG